MFDISRCVSYTGGSSLVARATRASLVISKTYIASHTCIGVCVCVEEERVWLQVSDARCL